MIIHAISIAGNRNKKRTEITVVRKRLQQKSLAAKSRSPDDYNWMLGGGACSSA